MDVLEQISFGILVPAISEPQCALLWETCSQGARREDGDEGKGWRQRGALFCRVKARGGRQGAGEAGRRAGTGEAGEGTTITLPLAQALAIFPRKSYFSVSHGSGETFLEVRQSNPPAAPGQT